MFFNYGEISHQQIDSFHINWHAMTITSGEQISKSRFSWQIRTGHVVLVVHCTPMALLLPKSLFRGVDVLSRDEVFDDSTAASGWDSVGVAILSTWSFCCSCSSTTWSPALSFLSLASSWSFPGPGRSFSVKSSSPSSRVPLHLPGVCVDWRCVDWRFTGGTYSCWFVLLSGS